jgi:CHAD domain-containing protein
MRVATRRLRATLALFAPLVPKALSRFGERELAWLGTAVGSVRDLDVLDRAVGDLAKRLDPESAERSARSPWPSASGRAVAQDGLTKTSALRAAGGCARASEPSPGHGSRRPRRLPR